jgi:tyrosyl-tRNA synthetase
MEKGAARAAAGEPQAGAPLRIYCGYDPSSPDLHLGHTISMRKLRQFQDLGHDVTFLIGTFTGMVGDPSDKESARRQQTLEDALDKARSYAEQAFRVLDRTRPGFVTTMSGCRNSPLATSCGWRATSPCSSFWRGRTSPNATRTATLSGCTNFSTR